MVTMERHAPAVLLPNPLTYDLISPLTALSPIAVLNGLGADGEVIEALRPHKANPLFVRNTPFQSLIIIHPRNMQWHRWRHRLHLPRRTHHRSPNPRLRVRLPRILRLGSHPRHHHASVEHHRTVMGALISFIAALSTKATTFGDAVGACKLGGAKLMAKLGRRMLWIRGTCRLILMQ